MDNLYTVCDGDGVLIADRITREEIYYLRGIQRVSGEVRPVLLPSGQPKPALVRPHKRRPFLWIATVERSIVVAALRLARGISEQLPFAQDNATGGWQNFSNDRGAGRYFDLNLEVSFSYRTTVRCAGERIIRQLMPKAVAA